MSNQSFDSEHKNSIRTHWGKPLLKFLNKHIGLKLSYLGLPSPDARDIEEWLDYIDEVIAFQCRKYPEPSNENQDRKEVIKLEERLRDYKRQGQLNNFNVYDGYLEEVLLKGIDNYGSAFQQSKTIKIYNLDFCNKITSPIEFIDNDGKYQNGYKFDAIDKILDYQKDSKGVKKFVLFLTIQASYNGEDLNDFITNPDTESHRDLIFRINSLKGANKKACILRLFVINALERKCRHYGFSPHFLPTITYSGLRNQSLLHFTLFACKSNKPHHVPWYQKLDDLCKQDEDFIQVNADCPKYSNPANLFSKSKTYEKIWA